MTFVISAWDLGLWIGVSSLIMFVASAFGSAQFGRVKTMVDLSRMKTIAIAFGIGFILIAAIKIMIMLASKVSPT